MKSKNTISCIIIDDEISSQKVLQHFISEVNTLTLKAICNNASEAFKFLQLNEQIDLLFLDINMPKQSGIEFYKTLKNPPKVIFTTAYPQFAVEGFEVNAIDYLLKPISFERFLTAVNKALSAMNKLDDNSDFIILKENKALHKVLFEDIIYLEAYGDYVKVHSTHKTITTHSTFTNFIENLPDYFLRVHKSFSINLNRMNHLSGNQITVDKHTIPIGQTYKQTVLNALNL